MFFLYCIGTHILRLLGANGSEDGSPLERQDGQPGAQDGQLGAQDGQLGSVLGAFLAHLEHFGADFIENVENAKTLRKLKVFKGFWVVWGVIWSQLEAMLGYVGVSLR